MTALNFLAMLRVSHFVTSVTLHCVELQEATDNTAGPCRYRSRATASHCSLTLAGLIHPRFCWNMASVMWCPKVRGSHYEQEGIASCIRGPVFESSRVITEIIWKGSVPIENAS
jgi:hypothetical protein